MMTAAVAAPKKARPPLYHAPIIIIIIARTPSTRPPATRENKRTESIRDIFHSPGGSVTVRWAD